MENSGQDGSQGEIERLHEALEAETRRCGEVQSQLDRADADFEEFVSLAAHNLRESLRDVSSFSELMAETYAGSLDSDAAVFLTRIREGAASMQSLLADVVDYWAADANAKKSSRTDMEDVLRQALLCSDEQILERSAIVTHERLAEVYGDFGTLTKILRHLIRNAIEYCEITPPRVHISALRADCVWVFSVQDNGPGIEPEFKDSVFRPFKRLHGPECPGNGLGLAFCRKNIERLGGRMWIDSTPGEGSTFFFALPAVD